MNKDELKGKLKQAKGKVKEKTGELIDDPELQAKGVADQAAGRVQEGFGTAKRKVSDAVEDLTDGTTRRSPVRDPPEGGRSASPSATIAARCYGRGSPRRSRSSSSPS